MSGIVVHEGRVDYDSPAAVREHIAFLALYDPQTLADLAEALLAEVEKLRGDR